MPYSTLEDLILAAGGEDNLTQLADWDNTGTINEDVIDRAIRAADGWINGFLRARDGSAAIKNPSPTLVELAAAEAIYWIKSKRPGAALSDDDRKDRDARRADLVDMRKGLIRPDTPDEPIAASTTTRRARFIENTGDVTRSSTKGTIW